ncbi:hypothetical protein MK079_01120 [Candidatus Gracilibacteria bacterium]|nr:hypothetical protein [Candidatus Gracilibacteria bacterium]
MQKKNINYNDFGSLVFLTRIIMSIVYIGIYTLFLVGVWGFFILARLHSHQFKEFSKNIVPITQLLFFTLLTLSILGYMLLIFGWNDGGNLDIRIPSSDQNSSNNIIY